MKYLKIFEQSIDTNILYVFDFDDTLVDTPEFEDFAIEYLSESNLVTDLINNSISKISVRKEDLKWQDNRIYVNDPNHTIKVNGNWVRKGNRVYLISPDIFGTTDLSLPKKTLELAEFYNTLENKCIVTARPESIRSKIENKMVELGLEYPKYGLHMYPYPNHYNAGGWKGNKIVELVNKTNFNNVIFYDDNIRYLKAATKVVKEKLPNLNYKFVKV